MPLKARENASSPGTPLPTGMAAGGEQKGVADGSDACGGEMLGAGRVLPAAWLPPWRLAGARAG